MSTETYEQNVGCAGDCSGCKAGCAEKQPSKADFLIPMNSFSKIKKVIGVVSGKGGVGKSLITSMLAVLLKRKGYETAILDADITGPSIPRAFGIVKQADTDGRGILPAFSKGGIKIMSVNLFLENSETPVVWRGPVIAGVVKQFWTDVVWGEVDYMLVDLPPGTGDVPLTVFQSLPLDGIIIVTSPQDLVSMIVGKAVNMANSMEIPVLGLVENYSYIQCKTCGERISVFGKSHIDGVSEKYNIPVLSKLPILSEISEAIDLGEAEGLEGEWLAEAVSCIESKCWILKNKGKAKIAVAADENNNISGHFGRCNQFTVYMINDNKLTGKSHLIIAKEGDSAKAETLLREKVTTVICGGIGMEAMEILMYNGILVIPGMKGDADVAAASYLDTNHKRIDD